MASRLGVAEDLAELKTALATFPNHAGQLDLRHIRLAVLLGHSTHAPDTFLTEACQLFDPDLGRDKVSKETARDLLINHIFLSIKVSEQLIEDGLFL